MVSRREIDELSPSDMMMIANCRRLKPNDVTVDTLTPVCVGDAV